ncbi:hypothetical protein [Blastopirellula marina]|uniref:Uncharacterized protein n=1 Tax=Blastopirellula marina DSM 3645 TaxID=314230 RepID=A3ZV22_9BACT|nr:hypothetical protein [Blastopirellula marina]EAQ79758.1 hypothetical protein DSM3645_24655 [Blastopirellula marina DSM 3645]
MLRPLLFSIIAVVGLSVVGSSAEAYFPGTFGPRVGYRGFGITNYGGPAYGYGNYGYGYSRINVPTPPYFALHPPVYYSHSVARPYGISPFPIGSYTPSQRVVYQTPTPEPQVVINPYVTTAAPVAEEAPADVAEETTATDAEATEEAAEQPAEAVTEETDEAAPAETKEAAASYWPTPQVVLNPFVDSNAVVPVSFTKIVTP